MIINSIAKDFENIIAIDTAKTSFQVYVVNQKTNRRRNDKVTRKKFVEHITKLGTGLILWNLVAQANIGLESLKN